MSFHPRNENELNFDAGRPASTLEIIDLSYLDFPPFSGSTTTILVKRFRAVQTLYRSIYLEWEELRALTEQGMPLGAILPVQTRHEIAGFLKNLRPFTPSLMSNHLHREAYVFQMRRFFETLLHGLQIHQYAIQVGERRTIPGKIEVDSLGQLFHRKKNDREPLLCDVFFGDIETNPNDIYFLGLIDTLANSIRHHPFFHEPYDEIGEIGPTLVGIELRADEMSSDPIYHNHNCAHLLMGFQDTALSVVQRAKDQALELQKQNPGF